MERWEVIERWVLVAMGSVLLGLCIWLGVFQSGVERFVWVALLVPCSFWMFWQAFYEDKLESESLPSRGERALWIGWLGFRRLVLGGMAALYGVGAFFLMARNAYGGGAVLLILALAAGWVAAYGGGRAQSLSDDRGVHHERNRRYRR